MRRALRIAGRVVVGLAALGAVASVWVLHASNQRLHRRLEVAPHDLPVPTDSAAAVERGRHLAQSVVLCVSCHRRDLGGNLMADNAVLRFAPPNLTRGRGGVGAAFIGPDGARRFERAVRHGLGADGTPLLVMPSDPFASLSDADVAALLAYVRALPPVDREVGRTYLGALGRVLLAAGVADEIAAERIDHARTPLDRPPADALEHGRYLADGSGCHFCHGPTLAGGPSRAGPPGAHDVPNISVARLGTWSEDDFVRALRTGRTPDGRTLRTGMPWQEYSGLSDAELRALWVYLRSRPPALATR